MLSIMNLGSCNPDHKVIVAGGAFQGLGIWKNSIQFLNPIEALFLAERRKLAIQIDTQTVSLQEGFCLIDGDGLLNHYIVYAHLSRLGYKIRIIGNNHFDVWKPHHRFSEPKSYTIIVVTDRGFNFDDLIFGTTIAYVEGSDINFVAINTVNSFNKVTTR